MEVPEIEKQIGINLYSTDTEGLGGQLRQEIEDFIVKEITNREEGQEGKYLIIELTKRDWDTHHLTRTLAKILQISRRESALRAQRIKGHLLLRKSVYLIPMNQILKKST
nr:tRNA pseudouridine(13) synthase TruD [Methanosarcina horonobensis]